MLRRITLTIPRQVLAARPSKLEIRHISISGQRMGSLKALDNPISSALPSDSFQLLPESEKAGAAEDALYEQQLKDVEAWWASPRYEGIKRPYSAADVVSKRGSQMQSYPSSVMARKLFNLIKEKEAAGLPISTSTFFARDYGHFLIIHSGRNRPRTNDTASSKSRGLIHIRLGLFICAHNHQRGFPRFW